MIYELIFSATGRSRKVRNIIGTVFEGEKTTIDLSATDMTGEKYNFTADDFCILISSVFEGRIPEPALHNLKKLQGNGAKVLLVAVFGNRAVDDCLLEMKDVMEERGFVPVAAIETSVQHSIVPQVAAERPDAEDKAELISFAAQVKAMLAEKTDFSTLSVPGKRPYVEMGGVSFKPAADDSCIECGLCAEKCPMEAIPHSDPRITEANKCITCMRCVEICPVQARSLPAEVLARVFTVMKPKFDGRKPNVLYMP